MEKNVKKENIPWPLLVVLLVLLTVLSSGKKSAPNLAEQGGGTAYPLVVANYSPAEKYGEPWSGRTQTFEGPPSRAVVTTQTVAELLLRLGLADRIAGVCGVFDAVTEGLEDEFAKLNIITTSYASKELVVGANPDVVIGRGGLFADADWGCGTVDDLNDMGIKTFVLNASRPDATIDDLYRDIEELGAIFDVRENAAAFIAETKAEFAAVTAKLADKPAKTYGWLWGGENGGVIIYAAGSEHFLNSTLERINLVNAFAGVSGDVSLEQVVLANPDILIYTVDDAPFFEELYANEALQSVNAIKNREIYVVTYNDFWGYGYQIFTGMEKLAGEVFGD